MYTIKVRAEFPGQIFPTDVEWIYTFSTLMRVNQFKVLCEKQGWQLEPTTPRESTPQEAFDHFSMVVRTYKEVGRPS